MCAAEGLGWFSTEPFEAVPGGSMEDVCALPPLGWAEIVVVSDETGRPLPGAVVEPAFVRFAGPSPWPRRALELFLSTARSVTDREGRARVGLGVGSRADLLVSGPGTAFSLIRKVRFGPDAVDLGTVRLSPGGELEVALDVDDPERYRGLTLIPTPIEPGDAAMDAEADEVVRRLLMRRPEPGGSVRWTGLPPGGYRIEARWLDPTTGERTRDFLGIAAVRPNGYELLELSLGEVEVTGRILGVPEQLLPELGVDAAGWGNRRGTVQIVQGEGGREVLRYRVRARADHPSLLVVRYGASSVPIAVVDPDQAKGGRIERDLAMPRGSLLVRVVDEGGDPVRGAEVRMMAAGVHDNLLRGLTDASGHAFLAGLRPGRWRVVAHSSRRGVSSVREVEVAEARTDLLLRLEAGHRLDGRVTDARGRGVARAAVYVAPRAVPTLRVTAITREDGRFTVGPLPEGPAVVLAVPPRRAWAFAVRELDPAQTGEVTLEVAPGVRGVVLVLGDRIWGGSYLGDSVEIDGVPVPWALLRAAGGMIWPAGPAEPGLLLHGFPPGRYRLVYRAGLAAREVLRTRPFRLDAEDAGGVVECTLER